MQKRNALTTVIVKEKVRRSIQRFLITKPNANSLAAGLGRSFLVCSHMFNKNILASKDLLDTNTSEAKTILNST